MVQLNRDAIYQCSHDLVENFCFDQRVVDVFQDMIKRSVPGYGMVLSLVQVLAEAYVQPASTLYDLGSSLGASTLAMSTVAAERNCRIVAVDASEAMVQQSQQNIAQLGLDCEIDVLCDDVRRVNMQSSSMVTMNFTLQFIPPAYRRAVIASVYQALLPGGVLMLSEKVQAEDRQTEQCLYSLHHGFKRANGYSDLEISQKRAALEEVMITDKLSVHRERLLEAGFKQVHVIFQALNFVSLLAIK